MVPPHSLTRLAGPIRRMLWTPIFYRAGAIFLVALGLRYAWISLLDIPLAHDGWFYFNGARSLAAGDGYRSLFTNAHTADLPPGYPLVLSALYVLFGTDFFLAQLFNAVAGAGAAALTYVLGRRFGNERIALTAGVLMAFFPSQIFFSSMIMTESLFVFLSVVLLLVLVVGLAGRTAMTHRQALVLGLLLGFMSLVRAEMPLVAVTLVALWKACGLRWPEIGRSFLIMAVGMALIITPWTVRNYIQLDKPVFIRGSSQDVPFNALRRSLSPDFDDPKYDLGRTPPPSAGYVARYYATNPWEALEHGWRKFDLLFLREGAFYWVELERPSSFTSDTAAPWEALSDAYYYAVALVALSGAPLWLRRRDRPLMVLLWFTASWAAIHLIFYPQARYHYPMLPVVCILTSIVVSEGWTLIAERFRDAPGPAG